MWGDRMTSCKLFSQPSWFVFYSLLRHECPAIRFECQCAFSSLRLQPPRHSWLVLYLLWWNLHTAHRFKCQCACFMLLMKQQVDDTRLLRSFRDEKLSHITVFVDASKCLSMSRDTRWLFLLSCLYIGLGFSSACLHYWGTEDVFRSPTKMKQRNTKTREWDSGSWLLCRCDSSATRS